MEISMLSNNQNRNIIYQRFLEKCNRNEVEIHDIIRLGYRLMKKEKLHHHFFGNNSLFETAKCLTLFALQLPEDINIDHSQLKLTQTDAEKIIHLFEKRISERVPV